MEWDQKRKHQTRNEIENKRVIQKSSINLGFIHLMKKALFLCLVFWVAVSCRNTGEHSHQASGKINNISVIIDDQLWNGEVGDAIRNRFASPVTGLAQEEPLFTINQYPVKLLEGFMTNSRNIILVKQESRPVFRIISNEFATPQNVVHISGRTVSEILAILEKNAPAIVSVMHRTEIAETQKRIDTALLDTRKISSKFGISLHVPSEYKIALESDDFIWLKKDVISGNMSVLVYAAPAKCLGKTHDPIAGIVRMRDSVGALYIHGTVPDSKMITEEAYAPYIAKLTIAGHKAYETRGTWELKNDYMSGPFINYAIADKPNNRLLVLEGFCYAPSKDKRDLVHELEAIIRSVKILRNPKPTVNADTIPDKVEN
jgi:hypothetical protein